MASYKEAVEIAANHLRKKEEQICKKTHNHEDQQQLQQDRSQKSQQRKQIYKCVRLEVEAGKSSTILTSPKADRKFDRREGVAEKNDTEQKLVKESVKVVTISKILKEL